jgi:hypothetical protein
VKKTKIRQKNVSVWPKPSEMDIFVASSANQDWLIPNQS